MINELRYPASLDGLQLIGGPTPDQVLASVRLLATSELIVVCVYLAFSGHEKLRTLGDVVRQISSLELLK